MNFRYFSLIMMAALGFAACQDPKLAGSGQVPVGPANAVDKDRDGIADGGRPVTKVEKQAPSSPVGSVQLMVVDAATGAPLKDMEFKVAVSKPVYDADGKPLADTAISAKTDQSGYATVNDIPFGDFVWSIGSDTYMPASGRSSLVNKGVFLGLMATATINLSKILSDRSIRWMWPLVTGSKEPG